MSLVLEPLLDHGAATVEVPDHVFPMARPPSLAASGFRRSRKQRLVLSHVDFLRSYRARASTSPATSAGYDAIMNPAHECVVAVVHRSDATP